MKRIIMAFSVVLISLSCLCSCEKAEEGKDIPVLANIPEAVRQDFYRRVGANIRVTEAYTEYNGVSTIEYRDRRGYTHRSVYKGEDWQMDVDFIEEDDLDVRLPRAVKKAFYSLDVNGPVRLFPDWRNQFYKIRRKGIDHDIYEFYFHWMLDNGNWFTSYAQILQEGKILTYSHSTFNTSYLFNDLDGAVSFINEKYEGCNIQGYANDSGENIFYVFHDGTDKKVIFVNNFQQDEDILSAWRHTEWMLGEDAVIPGGILEKVSDYPYSEVLYKEDGRGDYYGFRRFTDKERQETETIWIPSED